MGGLGGGTGAPGPGVRRPGREAGRPRLVLGSEPEPGPGLLSRSPGPAVEALGQPGAGGLPRRGSQQHLHGASMDWIFTQAVERKNVFIL